MPRRRNAQGILVRSTNGSFYASIHRPPSSAAPFPLAANERTAMLRPGRSVVMNGSLDPTDPHSALVSHPDTLTPSPCSSSNGNRICNGHSNPKHLRDSYYDEDVRPTLDRFAEDTTMLGFRFLHSRYKLWFRCMWALLLCFFLCLTLYQVCERISYYFISNPLKTTRTYETPTSVQFPTVAICNKMQIKASKVAEINPNLLRAISLTFDDEQRMTKNESIWRMLDEFADIDTFDFYIRTRQTVEDLFVSCQFGKSRNCMDNVRPILTPNGHCFVVDLNTTVRRPGPESTLYLLLNLETYENIPGWVSESGTFLSMFDSSVPTSVNYAEGMHLEPGKTVTIPINDVRRLQRHWSQCGSDARKQQKVFDSAEYSRSSCQWMTKMENERRKCGCEPALSPINRVFFTNTSSTQQLESPHINPLKTSGLPPCNISEEIFCVHQLKDEPLSAESLECPHDCTDVSFTSIVFGNELHTGDVSQFLPGDYEDEKEKRLEKFQLALENLPKDRINLVKAIQKISHEAQQFVQDSMLLFGISATSNTTAVPCFAEPDSSTFVENVQQFHREESVWTGLSEFLEFTFRRNVGSVLEFLGLEIDANFRLRERPESAERDERWYLTQSTQALYKIRGFRERVVRGGRGIAGLSSLKSYERVVITRHLFDFLKQLQQCIVKVQFTISRSNVTSALDECRDHFIAYYNVLLDTRTVERTLSTDVMSDFENGIQGFSGVLQRLKHESQYESPGSIFKINNYAVDLRRFCNLYKDGGKGYELLLDLLKFRKFIQTDIAEKIRRLVKTLESVRAARTSVLNRLQLNTSNGSANPIAFIDDTIHCLSSMLPRIEAIRRSPLIRAELMSRLHHLVMVAQAYSPGPEYDRVNLLFLKIYFTHFKEEIIIQERSYNMFLLLAEIGGTIGLYVGAALLSIAESIAFFFQKQILINGHN